ncbi:multiple C2 and transmembrane domain-containing protein 2 isoform X2 [Simochromis diagramma]|uniref:multiple C2 and transmembrane domain-containing protein 2 isoform X2 n=1 Tax=Simochromis diagramma TaxID=43689 RepID=UPI001A7E387D|nr:multiple C2 and transmembrane domain-containing protein 2 isoform X2 [Simochromis diagramma]
MENKKKNLAERFRLKPKFPNLKKPAKKPLAKQGRNLATRRSISVPDLTMVPGEASTEDASLSSAAFGISPGLSDTDSIASSEFADKLSDPIPEIRTRFLQPDHSNPALNRLSTPPGTLGIYEEMDDFSLENKTNPVVDELYAKIDKKGKGALSKFPFEPAPTGKKMSNSGQDPIPRPDLPERSEEVSEKGSRESLAAAALFRAQSMGEQINPYREKQNSSVEPKKTSSEKGTPPTKRQNARIDKLMLDSMGRPLESGDGNSLNSACGTPSEEKANMPWMRDVEEQDREPSSPLPMNEFIDENLLDETPADEEDEEELASESADFFDENASDVTGGCEDRVPAPFQRYLLKINLKRGKNLVIRDKRSGTSDPYVKFKIEGKQFYKSKVVYKDLNPRWNESFSHPLRDREYNIEVRVYDKNRTSDDFMGSSFISLRDLELQKTNEMELRLEDPKSKEDDMGVIIVDVCLMFRDATIKKGPRFGPKRNKNQATPAHRSAETQKNQLRNQMWTGVLCITLVEGQDMPQCGQGDIYVRFRLGDQKYKSKNLCIQPNPQWREQFDFNQFEDNQEPLQVEMCSKRGRKSEESWGMLEVDVSTLTVNEKQLYSYMLNPGKGRVVFLITLRSVWGVSISDIENATLSKPDEKDEVVEKFSLKNSHNCMRDIGILQVGVIRANDLPATDINGKSNALCVIELGNSKLQTHTVYKNVNPEWKKSFTFPIKDITDVVELTVFDENGDKAPNFLGTVAIPLLTVKNGQEITLLLKKEKLGSASKGSITLVLEVIYNKVGASVKSFQPKEAKLTEETIKFNKKVLAQSIYRVRKISTAVLSTLQYIKSCFQWESTQRSLIAFLIFLLTVWHWELFMLPLFLLLLIGWNYFQLSTGRASYNQDLVNMTIGDDEEEDEKEPGKKGLIDKIYMVQEVVLAVQNVLEEIANIGERVKNIFNWSVPFLSCLACLVLFVAAALLYLIPLRYIVLIWGINKFTKKLRNPYSIDSNEILDFLKRVPSDVQKVQYSVLRAPTSQNQARKKK